MRVVIKERFKVVYPKEGMVLSNGETTSKRIYTPLEDDLSSWTEIPDEEIADEDE